MGEFNSTVIGNLTKDAELKYSNNGKAYCIFNIGVTTGRDKFKKNFFVQVATFGKTAEGCAHLKKGQEVVVYGRNEVAKSNYNNKEYTFFKVVSNYVGLSVTTLASLLGASSGGGGQTPVDRPEEPVEPEGSEFSDEDIPF